MRILSGILLLALCGCTANGALYAPSKIQAKQAQIVIYRPAAFTGSLATQEVDVNGKAVCSMPNSSYFVADVSTGEESVSAPKWSDVYAGTSSVEFTAKAGSRYFVRVELNQGKLMGDFTGVFGFAAGVGGQTFANSVDTHKGQYVIELVDEKTARAEMAQMHGACQ